eukprot:CAMPEP_0196763866 /NCGR_PEP_ID=MMETSP1095-20130614/4889_1 /TAXON_ID=96789 ORGANISM="Chromulina nebulosa, Strain UTEXLB2642" /NCGR_SAMPLE_ID=MMETSP1095 /ASSEMBLY_ACC=CAM_ASM_000446 /LENGTH=369 /DNA_ID=CAMNT_0042117987 /DNA_START=89 /DNA_END=1198 /DNA_ORIENTATION=+
MPNNNSIPRLQTSNSIPLQSQPSQLSTVTYGSNEIVNNDIVSTIQTIFSSTTCYELMQSSSKAVVFEVNIPFQLAFYAMVENDTEVAPLWDPEKRCFSAIMTTYDYINALRICLLRGIPMIDLSSKTIEDMLNTPLLTFAHPYFDPLDAEETIYQLCRNLHHSASDYVPIIDPDSGALVSTLGYLDIVHLLDSAAKQYPELFEETLESMGIYSHMLHGAITTNKTSGALTLTKNMFLSEVLNVLESNHISGAPVVDEQGKVCSYYHKSDVTFITKATDPENILTNLRDMTLGEILLYRESIQSNGDSLTNIHGLVTCAIHDKLSVILNAMMIYRVTKVVCVDNLYQCKGVVSIKDILHYYLVNSANSHH